MFRAIFDKILSERNVERAEVTQVDTGIHFEITYHGGTRYVDTVTHESLTAADEAHVKGLIDSIGGEG